MAARGISPAEIGKIIGRHRTSVWRFLNTLEQEKVHVERYKQNRADVFAHLQGKAISLQHKIIEHVSNDRVLAALDDRAKVGLVNSLNNVYGTAYDKERLERGESTHNVSVLSQLLKRRVGSLYGKTLNSREMPTPHEGVGAIAEGQGEGTGGKSGCDE